MFWLHCFICILTIVITGVHSQTTHNAALGKNASLSSVYPHRYGDLTGDKATDGDKSKRFQDCASTAIDDYNAWWKVNLERIYSVMSVVITNRNAGGDRLHDVTVAVSIDDDNWAVCSQYPGPSTSGAIVTLSCHQAMWGHYIKITKQVSNADDIMTLCEVQVMAVERTYAVLKHQAGRTTMRYVIASMTGELLTCGRICKHTIDCLGINYNSGMSLCQLTNSTKSDDTTFDNSWDFYTLMP